MNFSEILNKKISDLAAQRDSITKLIADPRYHIERTEKMTLQVVQQLADLDLDHQALENEISSILQQVPEFIGGAWTEIQQTISTLDTEIARWTEMAVMYDKYKKDTAEPPQAPTEFSEPSVHTAMRRKPGERPPITLGAYRKSTAKLEGGEDS